MVLINFRFAFLAAIILSLSLWLVWSATLAQPEAIRWNGWSYSDWLINYQAGFIRRGLSGQIIAELSGQGLAAPVTNLVVFSLYALFAVTFFALAWIGSPKRDATLLLALLVPGGVFAMARDQQFFHRKEILFIIALQLASVLYILILSAKNNEKKKC